MSNTKYITITTPKTESNRMYNYEEWVEYDRNYYGGISTETMNKRNREDYLTLFFYGGRKIAYGVAKNFCRAIVKGAMDIIWKNHDHEFFKNFHCKTYADCIQKEKFFWRRYDSVWYIREVCKDLLFGRVWRYDYANRDSIELHTFDRSPIAKAEELWNKMLSDTYIPRDYVLIHFLTGDYKTRKSIYDRNTWVEVFDQIAKFGELDSIIKNELARRVGVASIKYDSTITYSLVSFDGDEVTIHTAYRKFEKDSGYVVEHGDEDITYELITVDPKRIGSKVYAPDHLEFIKKELGDKMGDYNCIEYLAPENGENDCW